MNLEPIDVFSIFASGFSLGIIGAHYLNRWELKREYERGVLDVLWEIWKINALRSIGVKSARHKALGGETDGKEAA